MSAVSDAATVSAITAEVKERLAQAIDQMLSRRKSIWHGSVFDDERIKYEENISGKERVT